MAKVHRENPAPFPIRRISATMTGLVATFIAFLATLALSVKFHLGLFVVIFVVSAIVGWFLAPKPRGGADGATGAPIGRIILELLIWTLGGLGVGAGLGFLIIAISKQNLASTTAAEQSIPQLAFAGMVILMTTFGFSVGVARGVVRLYIHRRSTT